MDPSILVRIQILDPTIWRYTANYTSLGESFTHSLRQSDDPVRTSLRVSDREPHVGLRLMASLVEAGAHQERIQLFPCLTGLHVAVYTVQIESSHHTPEV